MVRTQCRKIPNWKAPRPDGVQGYWIKKLDDLHECIAKQMDYMLNEKHMVPEWMTLGRTIPNLKNSANSNAADNFRPISCLPLMWKLMTGVIAESMYTFLDENKILPGEKKRCRRESRGTKDQLLIDRMVLRHCKKRHTNLAITWVDYRKAYDMMPHSWIIECPEFLQISDNIKQFFTRTMTKWRTELILSGESLGKVNIRRDIFQGNNLSPLMLVICMVPLTLVLKKLKEGYTMEHIRMNHMLFIDDLKLFGKSERQIE